MSYTSAPYARTFTQGISAVPLALAIPADIAPDEVWIYSTGAILVRGRATDPDVPIAPASTWVRIPYNVATSLLFTNTVAMSVMVLGGVNSTPVPSR